MKNKIKKGKAQILSKCCREVRLSGFNSNNKLHDIVTGFNTITDKMEAWEIIKLSKDPNNHVVQFCYSESFKDIFDGISSAPFN